MREANRIKNSTHYFIASGFDITTPIKEFHNGTCLHLVSNFGSITMAHLIMSRVSSIDFFNLLDKELRTAIMCAIIGGKNDILKLLMQCGADLSIKVRVYLLSLSLFVAEDILLLFSFSNSTFISTFKGHRRHDRITFGSENGQFGSVANLIGQLSGMRESVSIGEILERKRRRRMDGHSLGSRFG